MAKYIDVEALGIGMARAEIFANPEFARGWNNAIEIINNAPAADVTPVVHGELTEHIHELLRAEKDGRLVVLPCKIGATVYRFQRYFNDATLKSEIKIKPCVVESVSTKCIITTDHVVMLFSNFGKNVFRTREEAEKALKGNAERTEETDNE